MTGRAGNPEPAEADRRQPGEPRREHPVHAGEQQPVGAEPRDRDRETVRRGLRAGLVTWAVVGTALTAGTVVTGGSGRAGAMAVLLGLVVGNIVASGWLVLAVLVDVAVGRFPDRRRALWTAGVVLFTMISPALVVGAGG